MDRYGVTPEIRRWVETWKRAEPELEAIRRKEIRETDNVTAIAQMEGVINYATRTSPPRTTSGLVEMQRIFAKLRPQPR
jgi:hypothetical protein